MIIAISGLSGAGKTTVAKLLSKELNAMFIDQDWFYKEKKPRVVLSNGIEKSNWDCLEALDLKIMNKMILNSTNNIVICGFALRDDVFEKKPDVHIHLNVPKKVSLETRLKVKGFKDVTSEETMVNKLMFNEVVYPFYEETLRKSTIDKVVNVVNGEVRKSLKNEIEEILDYLSTVY